MFRSILSPFTLFISEIRKRGWTPFVVSFFMISTLVRILRLHSYLLVEAECLACSDSRIVGIYDSWVKNLIYVFAFANKEAHLPYIYFGHIPTLQVFFLALSIVCLVFGLWGKRFNLLAVAIFFLLNEIGTYYIIFFSGILEAPFIVYFLVAAVLLYLALYWVAIVFQESIWVCRGFKLFTLAYYVGLLLFQGYTESVATSNGYFQFLKIFISAVAYAVKSNF